MRRILGYYPYKIHNLHEMSDLDVGALETFYLKLLAQIKVEAARLGNILQTDEVYFHLNGRMNTHSCCICVTPPPPLQDLRPASSLNNDFRICEEPFLNATL
ncbi:hypothetical protein TNCV_2719771 [Trichonephila clavipes]|nr:hypothetical protein TNCV_2719771 [Trichonephila clavipes]